MASLLCAGMMGGCSHLGVKRENSEKKLNVTLAALEEESRALTTAVVDVLSVAPSNAPTALALELAKHDQQIEGVSAARINVGALMGADPAAVES
ncbi:MAG: hypothetical protein JWN25_1277 [Verrucomicrobiales bacterium]|nr:hypothetical protein [Verrucomicrobiales bacterium]